MKLKRSIAVLAAMVMACQTTVFGAEKTTSQESTKRVITVDEAIKLARDNNSTIKDLENTREALAVYLDIFWETKGEYAWPTSGKSRTYLDDELYSATSSLQTLESSIEGNKMGLSIAELVAELGVKTSMVYIDSLKDSLEILKINVDISRKNTNFSRIKYDLGMISKNDLDEDIRQNQKVENTYETAKLSYDSAMQQFANLLGLKDTDFVVEYTYDYEPYPEITDLDSLAMTVMRESLALEQQQLAVDSAEWNNNVRPKSDIEGDWYDLQIRRTELQLNLTEMEITYAQMEKDLAVSIKNLYRTIKSLELEVQDCAAEVEKAQTDYDNAVLNHELGYLTDVQLLSAEFALESAKLSYKQKIFEHENAVWTIEHPSTIALN